MTICLAGREVVPKSQQDAAGCGQFSCAPTSVQGIVVDMGEQERLVADVGTANTVFLRNHGIITIGKSIGALACTAQFLHRI